MVTLPVTADTGRERPSTQYSLTEGKGSGKDRARFFGTNWKRVALGARICDISENEGGEGGGSFVAGKRH